MLNCLSVLFAYSQTDIQSRVLNTATPNLFVCTQTEAMSIFSKLQRSHYAVLESPLISATLHFWGWDPLAQWVNLLAPRPVKGLWHHIQFLHKPDSVPVSHHKNQCIIQNIRKFNFAIKNWPGPGHLVYHMLQFYVCLCRNLHLKGIWPILPWLNQNVSYHQRNAFLRFSFLGLKFSVRQDLWVVYESVRRSKQW